MAQVFMAAWQTSDENGMPCDAIAAWLDLPKWAVTAVRPDFIDLPADPERRRIQMRPWVGYRC